MCFIIIILSVCMVFGGCGRREKAEEIPAEETVQLADTEMPTLTLHMQLSDEEYAPCSADSIVLLTKNGERITSPIENGEFSVSGIPYEPQISCILYRQSSVAAEFTLSFWTGFELDYHNNLNTLSIDIPGNTQNVYLKATVRNDTGKVTCDFVSQYSFDAEQEAEAEAHELTEEEAAAAGIYGVKYASTTGLNIRKQPGTESESVRKLNFGDSLSLMNNGEEVDGVMWYKVQYNAEISGYVSGEFLGKKYIVNKNGVNIRTQPTADSEVVHMVSQGAVVIAMDDGTKDGDYKWFKICTRDGLSGYIRNDFLILS